MRYEFADHSTQLAVVAHGLAVALVPNAATAIPDGVVLLRCQPMIQRELRVVRRAEGGVRALELLGAELSAAYSSV